MASNALIGNTSVADGLTEEAERIIRYTCLSNRVFELIVFPTEQCNFRCTYCYEDFNIGRMRAPVVDGICRLLEKKAPELDRLKIGYFGGEPLLNMPAIRQISGLAGDLMRQHGFELSSDMTTNGYLLDVERLEELINFSCRDFQISLDGWKEAHDSTRRQRNKLGSFDRIWSNLIAASRSDLKFHMILRVHMTPANAASLRELVDNINTELCDERFSVLLKAVGQWGGENEDHPEVFEYGSKGLIDLYNDLSSSINRSTSYGIDEAGGGAVATLPSNQYGVSGGIELPAMCYASKSNSLVVRSNGRINKCTVALRNPANDIGHIDAEGNLHIDAQKLAPWLAGVASLDRKHLSCPASKVIFGA